MPVPEKASSQQWTLFWKSMKSPLRGLESYALPAAPVRSDGTCH